MTCYAVCTCVWISSALHIRVWSWALGRPSWWKLLLKQLVNIFVFSLMSFIILLAWPLYCHLLLPGRQLDKIKAEAQEKGDLGLVAESSRSSQRMMFAPANLTAGGVFNKLKEIANMSGNSVSTTAVMIAILWMYYYNLTEMFFILIYFKIYLIVVCKYFDTFCIDSVWDLFLVFDLPGLCLLPIAFRCAEIYC